MKKNIYKLVWFTLFLFFISICIGCSSDEILLDSSEIDTGSDQNTLTKMLETDEELSSFEPNYNEEELSDIGLPKISTQIFPIKVRHKMELLEKTVDIKIEGDSAIALITKNFAGTLFILASYTEFERGDSINVDTLIEKSFTTTMTRYVIFDKIGDSEIPDSNWSIGAVSLPEGGTLNSGVNINKVKFVYGNGETFIIESPNEYFLERRPGKPRRIPSLLHNREVLIKVEVSSLSADEDFVTLTYGALKRARHHRAKKQFKLVSEEFDGTNYNRIYEQTFRTHQIRGFRHAVINTLSNKSIKDDAAQVEENTWGVPYYVN